MTRRTAPAAAPLLALLALSAPALVSCGATRAPSEPVVLALDEAFVAARPVLAARLVVDPKLGGYARYMPLTLGEGPSRALDSVAALKARSSGAVVLVASPLVAAALLAGGTWAGDPALVVPEWRGKAESDSGAAFSVAASDPTAAYAQAGWACGSYVAALSKAGGSPACGLIFLQSLDRPRSALEAFQSAFAANAPPAALIVRELAAPTEAASPPASVDAEAEAAAAELLGSDIRILFLAAGAGSPAALRAALRPGIAIGADYPQPETPVNLAFRVSPDETAIASALRTLVKAALARSASSIALPCLLTALPGAAAYAADGRDLGAFIEEARKANAGQR